MPTWNVLYEDALRAWENRVRPNSGERIAVLNWLLLVVDSGPPDDHLPVPLAEDLYVARVLETDVLITYLALAYERLVIVRRID